MKKTLANIRTLAALLIASAAFTACSNEDSAIIGEQPAQQQAPQVYTLTLQAGKTDGTQTRALALDGTKLVASWADGDQLTVTMADGTEVGTLTAPTASGQTATFSGTLTVPSGKTISGGDKLTLTYHPVASLAAYASQTGTLESAAACDMATAEVTVTAVGDGNKITITETSVNFTTQTAVLKITMQDTGGNKINATNLQVKVDFGGSIGTRTLVSISPTDATYTANGNGILYFALPNATKAKSMLPAPAYQTVFDAATVSFTVTKGDESYTIDTEKKYTFDAGKYYATTLTKPAPSLNITSPTVGQVIGSDGKNYAYGSLPSGVTAVAKICYVSGSNGLALALTDESGTMNWSTAQTTCAAHTAPFTGGTWKLASQDEWDNMISAAGSYTDLRDGFSSVGGTNMRSDDRYWSSTESESGRAWVYNFSNGNWGNGPKDFDYYVRACLAF